MDITNDFEILEYLGLHRIEETKQKFGISTRTLRAIVKRNNWKRPNIPEVRAATKRIKQEAAEKGKKTMLEHYGVESLSRIPGHHKKMMERALTPEAKEKRKETSFRKYGYEYANQSPKVKMKIKESLNTSGLKSGRRATIPKESLEILDNPEKLKRFIEDTDKSVRSKTLIGGRLGIARQTLGHYTGKYKLDYLFSKRGTSEGEERLSAIIENWGITVIRNSRKLLLPTRYSLDIYLPQFKVAIEYQGNYWHSLPEKKELDKKKYDLCLERGIRLIYVWDREFKKDTDRVVLNLFNELGLDKLGQLVLEVEEKTSEELIPFYDIEVESQNHNFLTEAGVVHNSKQFGQDLIKQGIPYKEQSIDRVVNGINPTYKVLSDAIYEGRVSLLDDEDQTTELLMLEKHESGRVDKPATGGSDDAAQALCGAVFGCSQFKEEVLYSGAVLMRSLGDSKTIRANTEITEDLIQSELEKQLAVYSTEAIKVNRNSGLKEDLDKFLGGQKPRANPNGIQGNPTVFWG